MCRFQCSDPITCKVPKYALGSIKQQLLSATTTDSLNQCFPPSSPPKFLRNRSVNFFSGSSDSEYSSSDDEMTYFPLEQNVRQKQRFSTLNTPECLSADNILIPKITTMTSNESSVDSRFTEEENTPKKASTENKEEEPKEVVKPQLKSILLKQRFFVDEKPKKKVKFADDCGKFLVRVRCIPAREKIDILWNDVNLQVGEMLYCLNCL
uniref:UBX domain-containing protein n=1 Tax=Meloidogyne hapla TaxID=6305 RepID=A0A1I8AZJ5_MELHA